MLDKKGQREMSGKTKGYDGSSDYWLENISNKMWENGEARQSSGIGI